MNVFRTRRQFVAGAGRVILALVGGPGLLHLAQKSVRAAAPIPARLVYSSPGEVDLNAWIGRGCSATASALGFFGLSVPAPYDIDFASETAAILTGMAPPSVSLDASGPTISGTPEGAWALFGVGAPAARLPADWSLVVGGVTQSVALDA